MNKLKVSDEIHELFTEEVACKACRDQCIASFFGAKRAIKYAKQAIEASEKAWRLVNELWPETCAGQWAYLRDQRALVRMVDGKIPELSTEPESTEGK